ncbi:hypothetical protein OZ411_42650 [Bradyrhizobium sp. Arg237L]|uniref:hypothetical protein n=1 Tax=Bradyrhizobium sp. Arg237L TaxID=3003352 RepID=UPI00249F7FBF|nr:hypothetical protein [Bradyrhizobium sp. Arg237L]MDI4239487.1 hypothetical protein [Bradyrhizobium sp. Arg237L]
MHSTPPLNSSSNNIAATTDIDCVNSTRRAFLAQAAAVTAGGAERQHPNEAGGSSRAYRKWERRWRKYLDEINWGAVGQAYHEARADFEEAKIAAARVNVRDLNELALKAATVYLYEDTREAHLGRMTPAIAVSVAIDLARMALPESSPAA